MRWNSLRREQRPDGPLGPKAIHRYLLRLTVFVSADYASWRQKNAFAIIFVRLQPASVGSAPARYSDLP